MNGMWIGLTFCTLIAFDGTIVQQRLVFLENKIHRFFSSSLFLLYGRGQGTKRLLIIKNAQASDAGIYYCIAVNQAGHANYTVEVEIDCKMSIGITFSSFFSLPCGFHLELFQ